MVLRLLFIFVLLLTPFLQLTAQNQAQRDSLLVMEYTKVTHPCGYLNDTEREVMHILNLARMYPKWYLYFFLRSPQTENERSLHQTMSSMKTIPEPLIPDSILFESARCHAQSSGKIGFIGHERKDKTCTENYGGECCEYGSNTAADIVLSLLIDEGVPSLGHRFICLSPSFGKIGVSMQPHKTYGTNTVLDFGH